MPTMLVVIAGPAGTGKTTLADNLANTIDPTRSDIGFDPVATDPDRLHHNAGLTFADVQGEMQAIREDIERASAFLTL